MTLLGAGSSTAAPTLLPLALWERRLTTAPLSNGEGADGWRMVDATTSHSAIRYSETEFYPFTNGGVTLLKTVLALFVLLSLSAANVGAARSCLQRNA